MRARLIEQLMGKGQISLRALMCAAVMLLVLVSLGVPVDGQTKSPLKSSSARDVIRRMAGSELPSSAVRIRSLSSPDRSTVEALAKVSTAFRFVKEGERWHIAEVRTGDNRWEDLSLILSALKVEEPSGMCEAETRTVATKEATATDPSVQLSRCLIAELVGVRLPSDAVRIKSVAPFGVGNAPSAVVETEVETSFRLRRGTDGKWRVAQIRAGGGDWTDVDSLVGAVNARKSERALLDIKALAGALEAFRRERGFYVEALTSGALVDHLAPRYLGRIIRLDPWHKPYLYEGTRDSYSLRSSGADGRPNTADDIVRRNGER